MALDPPQVNPMAVSEREDGQLVLTAELVLEDSGSEVYRRSFTQNHNPSNAITVARNELLSKMQVAIDRFKSEQQIFNSAALSNAIGYIQSSLVV